MPTEGLRKNTTTLFHSVLSAQVARVSRVLENHRNLTNHQICVTAGQVVTGGKFSVLIIPDADRTNAPVDTGLVLDLTDKDSAIVTFTGVIRGIVLLSTEYVPEPSVRMSAVISSFSRYKRTGLDGGQKERLDYVSSDLGTINSGFSNFSQRAENHTNMVYHQLAVTCDRPLLGSYAVRIMPDTEGESLETTVDTGLVLEFADAASALVRFGGIIRGIHLQAIEATDTGGEVRVVLSSAVERFDEVVYAYIGAPPDVSDEFNEHINDFDNPHQTSWNNLLNKPPVFLNRYVLRTAFSIPNEHELVIWENLEIDGGSLEVRPGGRMIVLHDRPQTDLTDPDFTYDVSDRLTQIDYDNGEQKIFTYTGDDLTRVDTLIDGTTLRKDFFYDVGGKLDYIDEYYL